MLATSDQEVERYSIQTTKPVQDLHISCPHDLSESLVAEFKQQFVGRNDVEIYDWGWSCRFRTGYVVLTWRGGVDPAFEEQLDADQRLLGHSIYNLSESLAEPGPIVATNKVSRS